MNETIYLSSNYNISISESDHPDYYLVDFILCDFDFNGNGVKLNRDTIETWMDTLVMNPVVGKIQGSDFTTHQYKNGKFSEVVYIGDYQNDKKPIYDVDEEGYYIKVAKLALTNNTIINTLNNYIKTALPDYKKLRLMIVAPENKYRSIVCQGIVSSTLFNLQDRVNNSPFSISSWSMRPLGHNYEPLADNMSREAEI